MTTKKPLPNRKADQPEQASGNSCPAAKDEPQTPDPYDPERFRLSQDFAANAGVKKILTKVSCRKPDRQEFIRVRPDEGWRLQTVIFEDRNGINSEAYLIEPDLLAELAEEIRPVCIFCTVNRQGDLFLWPVKVPGSDGRTNAWNESALAAAQHAESHWIRVVANRHAGMYDIYEATTELPEPQWPDLTFAEILRLCFQDRHIKDRSHPLLRRLRGEQ